MVSFDFSRKVFVPRPVKEVFYVYFAPKNVGVFFYNLFIGLYSFGVRLVAPFNPKARLWLHGRKDIFDKLKKWRRETGDSEKIIWMHCASLGEFEQGRPALEAARQLYPGYKILLTFFSPSGYEVRKNYNGADGIFYLPADTGKNAEAFVGIIKPDLVLWVKYEYWFHYLSVLKKNRVPVLLISAVYRADQPFFKWYGDVWRKMIRSFTKIFVQDGRSMSLLEKAGLASHAAVTGDTRFDRVLAAAAGGDPLPTLINEFTAGKTVIVAGSTWPEDEEALVHYARIHPEISFIIAPHEIDEERIEACRKLFSNSVCYSSGDVGTAQAQVLIIDNIGMLSRIYEAGMIAYIGGGFNAGGIHNILEAAVYGKPVVFGPTYEKFIEAKDLVERGAAFSINHALELENILDNLINDHERRVAIAAISKKYITEKSGATKAIMKYIQENRLLTN